MNGIFRLKKFEIYRLLPMLIMERKAFGTFTVPSHNKHTHNKHFSHNKHTLFALTKMCLFGEEDGFGKINSLCFFFNIESFTTHFLLF